MKRIKQKNTKFIQSKIRFKGGFKELNSPDKKKNKALKQMCWNKKIKIKSIYFIVGDCAIKTPLLKQKTICYQLETKVQEYFATKLPSEFKVSCKVYCPGQPEQQCDCVLSQPEPSLFAMKLTTLLIKRIATLFHI